jgi:peptidoglycan glycosyltransferase
LGRGTRRGVRAASRPQVRRRLSPSLAIATTAACGGLIAAALWQISEEPQIDLNEPLASMALVLSAISPASEEQPEPHPRAHRNTPAENPGAPDTLARLAPVSAAPAGSLVGGGLRPPPGRIFENLPASREAFDTSSAHLEREGAPDIGAPWNPPRLVEWVQPPMYRTDLAGPLRIEYSMEVELTRRVFKILRKGRVARGHVIVLEPESGRILAYASTDAEHFPATSAYPAASLVKIVTAAAALDGAPDEARRNCRYRGSPYRLTPSRVRPPKSGNEMSLERSLATSNNQCFAQLAVNVVGGDAMLAAIERFGWLAPPAPGHEKGSATAGDDDYDLGRLGCGLAGCRITPLHAAQLAGSLATGQLVEPWWVERVVDVHGHSLPLPKRPEPRRIMRPDVAKELREMLVRTTTRGTARSAFRDRRGRLRLGGIRVAGKTGNLTGDQPAGRYEWFVGVAPAESPKVAVAVLQLQSDLWWVRSSQLAADVFSAIFCEGRVCHPELASRYTHAHDRDAPAAPDPGLGG